jgi:hypothetical protein
MPYGLDEVSRLIMMLMPDSYPEASKLTQEQQQKLPMCLTSAKVAQVETFG